MAEDTDSIHVPASTVRRIGAAWRWLVPYLTGGAIAAAGYSLTWLESRVSRTELGIAVGKVQTVASAAQATAYHAESLATDHSDQLASVWRYVIQIEAELIVYRDFGRADPARRGRLIEAAKRFYTNEFETQLRTHANDPTEAARIALLAPWRPDP